MAIIETISEIQFVQRFADYQRKDFSHKGLRALFNYLDELSEDTGENIEMDVIALCCDYAESSLEEIKKEYSDIKTMDDLRDKTTLIDVDDETFIYQIF